MQSLDPVAPSHIPHAFLNEYGGGSRHVVMFLEAYRARRREIELQSFDRASSCRCLRDYFGAIPGEVFRPRDRGVGQNNSTALPSTGSGAR